MEAFLTYRSRWPGVPRFQTTLLVFRYSSPAVKDAPIRCLGWAGELSGPLGAGGTVADVSFCHSKRTDQLSRDHKPGAVLARNLQHEWPGDRPGSDPRRLQSSGGFRKSRGRGQHRDPDILHRSWAGDQSAADRLARGPASLVYADDSDLNYRW